MIRGGKTKGEERRGEEEEEEEEVGRGRRGGSRRKEEEEEEEKEKNKIKNWRVRKGGSGASKRDPFPRTERSVP